MVYSTFTYYNQTTPETNQNVANVKYNSYIEARKFAEGFNSAFEAEGVCDADGHSTVSTLASVWSDQATEFDSLDEYAQTILTGAEASSKASATAVEKCAAKYDYIGGKYQTELGAEFDFMARNPSPVESGRINDLYDAASDSNTMVIIIAIAATSAIALGTLLVLKKKKHN